MSHTHIRFRVSVRLPATLAKLEELERDYERYLRVAEGNSGSSKVQRERGDSGIPITGANEYFIQIFYRILKILLKFIKHLIATVLV